jgi:hypothetical protein
MSAELHTLLQCPVHEDIDDVDSNLHIILLSV